MSHMGHEHDDLAELGGLSADERDQLAADLRREQDLEREREHVTDGTPCWCEPTIEDYRGSTVDPDAVVPGVDATTGLSLHTPIVNAATDGVEPRSSRENLRVAPYESFREPRTGETLYRQRPATNCLLQPLNDQVFLVRVQSPDRTASGLAIPESAQSKGCECRVLCVGSGAKHARTGECIPMSVAAGDRVVIGKWQGNEVTVPDHVRAAWGIDDREPVIVVRETEILAVVSIQE